MLVGFVVSFVYAISEVATPNAEKERAVTKVYFHSKRKPVRIFELGLRDEALTFRESEPPLYWGDDDSNINMLRKARACEFALANKENARDPQEQGKLNKCGIAETLWVTDEFKKSQFVILYDKKIGFMALDLWGYIRGGSKVRLANQLVDLFHNGDEQGEYKIRIKVDPLIWGIVFEKTKRNEAIKMNASLVYHVEGRDDIEKRLVLASDKFLESMDILREKKSGFGDSEKQVMLSLFANFCEGDTTKCHGGLLPCWLLLLASWGYITRKKRLDLLSAIEKDRVTKKDEKDIIVECIMDVLDDILAVKTPLLAEFVESKKCAKADIEGHLG